MHFEKDLEREAFMATVTRTWMSWKKGCQATEDLEYQEANHVEHSLRVYYGADSVLGTLSGKVGLMTK